MQAVKFFASLLICLLIRVTLGIMSKISCFIVGIYINRLRPTEGTKGGRFSISNRGVD